MAGLAASTWGDPNATKRVLLIHGLTESSHYWHRIAQEFTSRGYFVVAPDLLGHGYARRGSDYTIAALAEELRPHFTTTGGDDRAYNIIVGHSLGGVVATFLLPLLNSTRPVRVVITDPPLEQTPGSLAFHRKLRNDELRDPKTFEAYHQELPLWTKEDVLAKYLSVRLCDVATNDAIFDQNVPWSFAHRLSTVPDNVKVTVLVADPCMHACSKIEELEPYPHIDARIVRGATHNIPMEFTQLLIDTALEGTIA